MFSKKYDFYDSNQFYYTNLLSGQIGSGKTSFLMKYLYSLVTPKRDKQGNIDHSFSLPFQRIFINIDGFAFEAFNNLAKQNGLNVEFRWLDMQDFKDFAYRERELYTKFNSDGQGTIAKRVEEHIEDHYRSYLGSLIVCDEADHWLTKKDDPLANFLKFKRHYGMEIWFLTQKFQNLNSSFYSSGAINRFLRIRSSIFNLGKSRYIQLWATSDTSKADNLLDTYSFYVEKEIFELYDSGAALANNNKSIKRKLMLPLTLMLFGIPFGGYNIYKFFTKNKEENHVSSKSLVEKVSKNTPLKPIIEESPKPTHIVKCISFGDTSNCYFRSYFNSIPTKYIFNLAKSKLTTIQTIYSYRDITFLALDDGALHLLFGSEINLNKKDEND